MPLKSKSLSAPADTETFVPTSVELPDAPPSFLEKPERAVAEQVAHGDRSNLQLYLQEIGKTALLTIDEEISLA
ncbi:MAG TPA: sigma-70 factor domain-containing protein, partial [Opitutus sp.]|nr:sigma-70 factor domain-containing protein [Opitutus sp.]